MGGRYSLWLRSIVLSDLDVDYYQWEDNILVTELADSIVHLSTLRAKDPTKTVCSFCELQQVGFKSGHLHRFFPVQTTRGLIGSLHKHKPRRSWPLEVITT